jgi:hypothetical protein
VGEFFLMEGLRAGKGPDGGLFFLDCGYFWFLSPSWGFRPFCEISEVQASALAIFDFVGKVAVNAVYGREVSVGYFCG